MHAARELLRATAGWAPLQARFSALCKNFAFYFEPREACHSCLLPLPSRGLVILSQVLVCSGGRLNNDRNDKNDKPARKKKIINFSRPLFRAGRPFRRPEPRPEYRGRNSDLAPFGAPRFLSRAAPGLIRSMSLANMATPTARRKVDE